MGMGLPGQHRQTGKGPYRYMTANWKAAIACEDGDLVFQDTADANAAGAPYDKPAGSFTWTTNIATTQANFQRYFRGVSTVRRIVGQAVDGTEVTDGGIVATGEFTFPCAALAAAAIAGDLVGPAKATGDALDPKKVVIVTDPDAAIGRVTVAAAVGATQLTFELLSPIIGVPSRSTGVVAVTATTGGGTTGLIPAGAKFVTVTSDSADKQISLPGGTVGDDMHILVGTTGCELISSVAADKVNEVVVGATNELALTAEALYWCRYTKAGFWVVTGHTKLGAAIAALVPDAL